MKIAVIGGGFTGLTATYELLKKGYNVTLFESQSDFGGLASAFEIMPGVFIERFYHHWFTNDDDVLDLSRELRMADQLKVLHGRTSHFYQGKIYPLDSLLAVLRFSPLSLSERMRFGLVTLYLKLKSNGADFKKTTADEWLRKWYGEKSYQIVWQPLLKGKFSSSFDQISMVWFWARVKKRTPKLIYPRGGFETIIDVLVKRIKEGGGTLLAEVRIESLVQEDGGWRLRLAGQGQAGPSETVFDKLVVTTSLKTLLRLFPDLPPDYQKRIDSISYLNAQVLILVLRQPLSRHYWINIGDSSFPFLIIGEQSNLMGLEPYQGKSLVYLGNYLPDGDPRLTMTSEQLVDLYEPYLKKINPQFNRDGIVKAHNFVGPFAQPIVDLDYEGKIPPFEVPGYQNLYLATMAQVYPWDRGTNYAVKLAKDLVSQCF